MYQAITNSKHIQQDYWQAKWNSGFESGFWKQSGMFYTCKK